MHPFEGCWSDCGKAVSFGPSSSSCAHLLHPIIPKSLHFRLRGAFIAISRGWSMNVTLINVTIDSKLFNLILCNYISQANCNTLFVWDVLWKRITQFSKIGSGKSWEHWRRGAPYTRDLIFACIYNTRLIYATVRTVYPGIS